MHKMKAEEEQVLVRPSIHYVPFSHTFVKVACERKSTVANTEAVICL